MKEQFLVLRVLIDPQTGNFLFVNPNGEGTIIEPPTFDNYKDAETWIKEKGKKHKWHQIQKFLMPN